MRGRQDRAREDMATLGWAAWHTAGFVKAKRAPNLATFIRKITRRQRPEQTAKQGVRVAEMLNRMFGGKDTRTRKD